MQMLRGREIEWVRRRRCNANGRRMRRGAEKRPPIQGGLTCQCRFDLRPRLLRRMVLAPTKDWALLNAVHEQFVRL
jgi:hypothetical protein